MQKILEFKNINKYYQEDQVLDNINFEVYQGEIFVIVGTSGGGKSTLLKLINKLEIPTSGEINFIGKNIKEYKTRDFRFKIGNVFQDVLLFPHLTVKENLELIPKIQKKQENFEEKIKKLMENVNLDPQKYLTKYPTELSRGEGQRIGVIRAMLTTPQLILMDEPFGAIDPIERKRMQEMLLSIQKKNKNTIIFITHDIDEANKLADRIMLIDKGKIIKIGKKEEFINNQDQFINKFFQKNELQKVKELENKIEELELKLAKLNEK